MLLSVSNDVPIRANVDGNGGVYACNQTRDLPGGDRVSLDGPSFRASNWANDGAPPPQGAPVEVYVVGRLALRRSRSYTEGAPANNQSAITGSQMAHPSDEPGANGTMGFP